MNDTNRCFMSKTLNAFSENSKMRSYSVLPRSRSISHSANITTSEWTAQSSWSHSDRRDALLNSSVSDVIDKTKTRVTISDNNDWQWLHFLTLPFTELWIVQCFTSPPTQYRLYGRRFLQVKRPNQQYQSTEGDATKEKAKNENN